MSPLDCISNSDLSVDEIIAEIMSLPWVRKFEYDPRSGFLHAEVERDRCQPFQIVQKLEELRIPPDGLFIFFPESLLVHSAQHLRYNARLKSFIHSKGEAVDQEKLKIAA